MRVRKKTEKTGWAFGLGVGVLKPTLTALSARVWSGGENIPAHGPAIVVPNHISHLDPVTVAHFIYDHGRVPRFLAKSGLFKSKITGFYFRSAGQIPVERLSTNAVGAYDAAIEAIKQGKIVLIYPEGTLTRDPDLWPMRGKTGAARIALATGAPVIPVGHWGEQEILPPYAKKPHLRPHGRRGTVTVKAGPPVDLSDLMGKEAKGEVVQEATNRIMAAITGIVEELRGEKAPAVRFDPRAAGLKQTGNPNSKDKKWRR